MAVSNASIVRKEIKATREYVAGSPLPVLADATETEFPNVQSLRDRLEKDIGKGYGKGSLSDLFTLAIRQLKIFPKIVGKPVRTFTLYDEGYTAAEVKETRSNNAAEGKAHRFGMVEVKSDARTKLIEWAWANGCRVSETWAYMDVSKVRAKIQTWAQNGGKGESFAKEFGVVNAPTFCG